MFLTPEQIGLAGSTPPLGLYVHVPFCIRRCRYCDFNSNVFHPRLASPFVGAVLAEMNFWRARLDLSQIRTVFIGGGTPTVLPGDELSRLIEGIVGAQPDEFTIEANPATVDASLARRLRSLGVNRISLGAQSFDPGELALLGRIHSVEQIGQSVRIAREAGLDNINLDLMYGLPGQGLGRWRANLAAAVALAALGVEHLSCYALSLEPGTPLAKAVAAGELSAPSDETAVAMYRAAEADLAAGGFEHYEISNWARVGPAVRQCRHNLLYWENRPWLGVGPSAASYLGGMRFRGQGDLAGYLGGDRTGAEDGPARQNADGPARQIGGGPGQQGQPEYVDIEHLTGLAAAGEAIMLALRMRRGLDAAEFARRYGVDVRQQYAGPIARHIASGMLRWSPPPCIHGGLNAEGRPVGGRLQLTEQALPVADSVLVDFISWPGV